MSYKKQDHYYHEAKKLGYRARSAFKLKQIQKKFYVIRRGEVVVDLGAAPGGWTQVAAEQVGKKGRVIAVDKNPIRKFNKDNISVLQMDMRSPRLKQYLLDELGQPADVVLSDLAGNTMGNWHTDSERQLYLTSLALEVCESILKPGGIFVTKVFRGQSIKEFEGEMKPKFASIRHWRPPATRKSSAEEYFICKDFVPGVSDE